MTTDPAHDYAEAFGHPTPPDAPAPPPTPQQPYITGQFTAGPQAAPPPDPNAPPIFGRRKSNARRIPFTLLTYRGEAEEPVELTARADIDTGSVFSLGRGGRSTAEQIDAIRKLLLRTLVDDDGIPLRSRAQQVAPNPDNDPDDLVPVDQLPNDTWSAADVEWRTPDGELHDNPGDADAHMRDHGSSLRRFVAIMDDDELWMEQSALEEIIDYLMTQAADRPTRRSSPPSRSRRPKGR